jgi:hypothetical protein
MASSIIQGGPAPSFLADIVYDYMMDGCSSIQTDSWVTLVEDKTLQQAMKRYSLGLKQRSYKSNIIFLTVFLHELAYNS